MSNFSFKDTVKSQYRNRILATAPVKEVDAYIFCTSSKYLGERLFPWQALAIKIIYGLWKKYDITEEEQHVVDLLKDTWHIDLDLMARDPEQFIEILILVLGRRSGKSSLISFVQTYEAYKLICKGDTTPEIADELNLSPRTIEFHRNNLLDKTGAKNAAGLVAFAYQNDLPDLDFQFR